ncbi:GIY-YIG nuclease family protein [Lysobacter sp. Root494]|uniref:GIY-YIG nuclease family protein n=1 Tax=Lysobacter sp. Root494 TaxID=1736549 RepID=UPI0009EB006D|nr:GIY-YIG nuclease family protein [Lysobacter sp. Root494]
MPVDPRDPATTRTLSRNRCFLYVAPCAYEDQLKLGFSRDPLRRFQSLHRRWFEFFDVDRIALVETEAVRDARSLESRFKREFAEFNATVPLTIAPEAGGHGEWYRGAQAGLDHALLSLENEGYAMHAPARDWLRDRLMQQRELLYSWTEAMLTIDELEHRAGSTPAQDAVRDALDALRAFAIPFEESLPAGVLRWYVEGDGNR